MTIPINHQIRGHNLGAPPSSQATPTRTTNYATLNNRPQYANGNANGNRVGGYVGGSGGGGSLKKGSPGGGGGGNGVVAANHYVGTMLGTASAAGASIKKKLASAGVTSNGKTELESHHHQ